MYNEQTVQNRFKSIQTVCAGAFTLLLIVGIAVCAICDMAISHAFTWSLYPISSIIFAWLVLIPMIRFSEKGIWGSLAACSIFIVPFLYTLSRLMKAGHLFLSVSLSTAVVGVVCLWIIFALFKVLRARKLLAAALSVLLLIPADILISLILSNMISEEFLDVWDIVGFSAAVITAALLFIIDSVNQKRNQVERRN